MDDQEELSYISVPAAVEAAEGGRRLHAASKIEHKYDVSRR